MFDFNEENVLPRWTLQISVMIACVSLLVFLIKSKLRSGGAQPDHDVVVLYQLPRGPKAPSVSPFPLKLETFLRMANIPYVNDFSGKFSSKGKTPWMIHNGDVVADSQLCIEYLKKKRGVDLNSHLNDTEISTARAFLKLTEENLYWTMCAYTFGEDLTSLKAVLPYRGLKFWIIARLIRRSVQNSMWGHGIGRHSADDIWMIGKQDLTAISHFLGDTRYFMGDLPSEIDCALFGMLSMILYHMPGSPHEKLMKEDLPNLVRYCSFMQDTFWPDWNQCITDPDTASCGDPTSNSVPVTVTPYEAK